jgi:hypothetical protein
MMKYILLAALLFSPVIQAQQDDLLGKLLLLSGLEAAVASYPGQLAAQLGRQSASGPDDKTRQQAQQRLLDSYNKMDAQALLRRYVTAELNRNEMHAIVAWFESPQGQRLILAEQQAATAAGAAAMTTYLAELDNIPADAERIRLMRRFEEVARLSAINMTMIRTMYETEFLAINAELNVSERKSDTQLTEMMKQQFYGMQAMMIPGLIMRLMSVSYYVLRELTNDELQTYIDFLTSVVGHKLIMLYQRAPVYIFGQVVRRAGMEVTPGFLQFP